ncbi:IS110 family transposase [Actinosynnema pretiosum]|uniref:IS110 family transposase n=1 Tax=Actinosynnema pretiosum TaxID=42197 RepID=UPI002646B224|nr:transposase [Actinosynnema pretiosum]
MVADGEPVVDVPAELAAWARVFDTGHGHKTDATGARSIALVVLRTGGPDRVAADDHTVALRLLVDRRGELGRARTNTVNRQHKLLRSTTGCSEG